MNATDVGRVLAKAAAFDQRKVGQSDVLAWLEAIGHLPVNDALAAVTRHYQESSDRLQPAHVIEQVRAIRNDRAGQAHSEALSIPSRFETDVTRDITVSAGVARCRDVLQPILDRLQAARDAERGELSESDQKLNLARQRAREMRRGGQMEVGR
jgi:hypothetical protein